MDDTISTQQRETDNSNGDSSVESYQHYASHNLPEGYTPYRETGQNVYDRYESDYEDEETADQADQRSCTKKSCCKIGRLSKMKIRLGHSRAQFRAAGVLEFRRKKSP